MARPPRLLALAILAVLAAAGLAGAQERVAQLSQVTGTVTVTRADGRVDEATQLGPRVRNGSVFGGDVVATGAGTASLLFSDGSSVELQPATSLSVEEAKLPELEARATGKTIGRRIRVLAGDILAEIAPSAQIATEFQTLTGVAAVKGTRLEISVARVEPGR